MQKWNVECPVCRWRFQVEADAMPVSIPGASFVETPHHEIRDALGESMRGTHCVGTGRPGIGMGASAS